jgi:hypothetical protein
MNNPKYSLRLFAVLYIVLTATVSLGVAIVPGKAFDRFVTIWLENEASSASF